MSDYLLSIDVGTRSLRAALVSVTGELAAQCIMPLSVHHPDRDQAEQSSGDIWRQILRAIQQVLQENQPIHPGQILSIGFDSTYSLLFLDQTKHPGQLHQY